MRKPTSTTPPNGSLHKGRKSANHILRFAVIASVMLAGLALLVFQTTRAKTTTAQTQKGKTYTPTQQQIGRFSPIDVAAAARQEALKPTGAPPTEIRSIDPPKDRPPHPGGVPINSAAKSLNTPLAPPPSPTGPSPGPSKTFQGEFLSGTSIPPDTMGAVGTTHVVVPSNNMMRITDRNGIELQRITLNSFWAGTTVKGSAVTSAFDPKILFDRFNNRFIFVASLNGPGQFSGMGLAVTQTADPTGMWNRFTAASDPAGTGAPGGSGHAIDYPSVGHNKNWIVVNENTFNYTCGASTCSFTTYWGPQIFVFDKAAAYANTLGSASLFEANFTATCLTSATPETELACGFTMAPAITEDNTTLTDYMVEDWDNVAAQLRLSKVTGTPAAPALTIGTQFPQSPFSWRFDAARIGTANSCGGTCSGGYAPQRQQSAHLASGTRLMTNDSRIQNAVLRNGSLWTTHTVMLATTPTAAGTGFGLANPDNHSAVQWWQIDPTLETGVSQLPTQRARIEDPTADNCHNGAGGTNAVGPRCTSTATQTGTFFAYPNISVNQNNDVLIGFTQFSPLTYSAGAYAMRLAADPPNTTRDPVVFRPGQANYNIGAGAGTARQNRWGDYSAAQTDPVNDTDFWTIQEYAGAQRDFGIGIAGPWETWWALVKPSTAAPSTTGNLIISEFRLRGPQGVNDEFVELYNPGTSPVIVSTADNSDGWALAYSTTAGVISGVAVIPNGTVIPAKGHFLIARNQDSVNGPTLTYSLNLYPAVQARSANSDTGYAVDNADNGGLAIFKTATVANFSAVNRMDSVGFTAAGINALFKEGTGLPDISATTPAGQMTFYRNLSSGTPQDTDNNSADFVFADPVIEVLTVTPKLGAAGPENLDGPIHLTSGGAVTASLLDTGVGSGTPPNTVRDNTAVANGAFGTLTFRRTFTNSTGVPLTRLRFRIVDITTNPVSGSAADLRALSSSAGTVTLSNGSMVSVGGTTLETPPTQAAGGGFNSSLSAAGVTLAAPLAAAATTNLQFTLGVQVTGQYNFCIIVEADAPAASTVLCFSGATEAPDLAITKTDGVTTATPGGSTTYTITASNPGPSAATGATVADTFPAILTCTWTCVGAGGGTCTAAGSGNISDPVNLPSGGSVTYTTTCAIAASATGTLSNTATVAIAGDPNPANNSATDNDTLTPQANLGITKTDGVTTATPGGSVTYTITASNPGPSNAPGATVADTFPAILSCTWTCAGAGGGTCTAAGSGNINDTANLPAGGSVTYTASCSIAASATGTLSNTATVAAPGGVTDPTPGNNSATDTDTLTPQANLGITKTDGVTTASPGGSVTYTIVASNAGPSNAPGSTVADTFPASLTCTWTCTGAGGGTCTAAGSGNINDTANLPSGGSVTYTASCTISGAATGSLSNTATVTAPGGVTDPTPGNNSATDTDTLNPSADLAITKTDGVTTATPGGSVTYTIVASNAGPSTATSATVADTFPASLTCSWTSVAAGGATGNTPGPVAGNINNTGLNLPAGSSVTYTASCTISPSATGSLANTATVSSAVTDPNPANNSATDTDTLNPSADLSITKTDGVTTYAANGTVTYTIVVSNAGPSQATGAVVTDNKPTQISQWTWVCSGATGGATACDGVTNSAANFSDTVTLPAGSTLTYTVTATIGAAPSGNLVNTATVAAPGGTTDPNGGNNSATDTDTLTVGAPPVLTGNITDPLACTGPGNLITGTIQLTNPTGAQQTFTLTTTFTNLIGLQGSCTLAGAVAGATCSIAPNGASLTAGGSIPANGTLTVQYQAQVAVVPTGTVVTASSVASVGGAPATPNPLVLTATVNCPAVGPGVLFPDTADVSDQKAGSVLVYNLYSSSIAAPNAQNTRISITNTHPGLSIAVHLFFVDGATCSIADSLVCLTPNQTASFLASDIDPGTTGYVVAVASDRITGCPIDFNYLIGDAYVKLSSGHAANLAAEGFAAIAGGLPACNGLSVTALLSFDGTSYNRAPRVLAASNIPSRADGNDTLIVLNRIGGSLAAGASTLGSIFGILYDDAENPLSFTFTAGVCQFRSSLSSSFPRVAPRFEQFVPAGRSSWAKFYSQSDIALLGAQLNFNANAGTAANAFNQGHNLHKLTLTTAATLTIPIFPPNC